MFSITIKHVKFDCSKVKTFGIAGAYSRNLGQPSILARKGNFYEKGHFFQKIPLKFHPTPYSIVFLSVLHENKALLNFGKRGQCSIAERIIGLEYALIALAYRSSFRLFNTVLKTCIESCERAAASAFNMPWKSPPMNSSGKVTIGAGSLWIPSVI